jgi:Tol biopolymer transport system component
MCFTFSGCGDDDPAETDSGVNEDGGMNPPDGGEPQGDASIDSDATTPDQTTLPGTLRGPVGATVTLRSGDETLEVTVTRSPGVIDDYDEVSFDLPNGAEGDRYEVTIDEQPEGLACIVYKGGSGELPVAQGDLRVGCEWRFAHVSQSTDDEVLGTFYDSTDPVVGGSNEPLGATTAGYGEGRFVAFVSSAAGFEGGDDYRQIYWRDTLTGETLLVSTAADGGPGDGSSFAPAISADGKLVAFESYATNLVGDDTNEVRDVFVWDATDPDAVVRVSVADDGTEADGESFSPTISRDGSIVAFATTASNLTTGVAGTTDVNVVRRDLTTETNTLVTRDALGDAAGGDRPMLSEDGNRLVFWSYAADLTDGDTNGLWDIFVYQHDEASLTRVSLRSDGGERDQGDESASRVVSPSISGNGRFVAYATTATNVVEGDTNGVQDVFVVDLDDLSVRRVSLSVGGDEGDGDSPSGQGERAPLSYDGRWIAFTSKATTFGASSPGHMFLRDLESDEIRAVTDFTFGTGAPSISRSGAYVAFGAGSELDNRFDSTGLFVHFTNADRAWWWID